MSTGFKILWSEKIILYTFSKVVFKHMHRAKVMCTQFNSLQFSTIFNMVKIAFVENNDYFVAKMMKFLVKFILPLTKDKKDELYSFKWTSWKSVVHILLFGTIFSTFLMSYLQSDENPHLGKQSIHITTP